MAKIIITTKNMYGAWFSLRLLEEGHDVDIYYANSNKYFSKALAGITPEPFFKKPTYDKYDLSIFDSTDMPELAEESARVTPTIGDGNINTEIENNRLLGIQIMEQCDINVPFYEVFDDINEAKKFIRKTKKRYVYKPDADAEQDLSATYVSRDAEDLLKYLDKLSSKSTAKQFILQEVVDGTEISTQAWFNGEDFFLISGTVEEKKFMNDGCGPNTGCAGDLEIIYDDLNRPIIFQEGLGKTKDFLQQYKFKGYIDLNTIVTDRKIYGLEWTPRFGYDSSAILLGLIDSNLGDFLGDVATGQTPNFSKANHYAAGVRLSVPPYPTEIEGEHPKDIPIEGLEEDDCVKDCYLYDCYLNQSDELCTAGISGFVAVPIATGQSCEEAFSKVYAKIKKIQIPDMQYRTDAGKKCYERYKAASLMGWLRS